MAWRIRHNKTTPLGREITIGDINRNALLPLCLQPINQQCQVNFFANRPMAAAIARQGFQRIFSNQAAIMQQAANQR